MQSHLTCICMTYLFCLMRKGVRMKWRSDSNFCFLRIGLTCKSQLDTPIQSISRVSNPVVVRQMSSKCWKLRHSWSECNRLVSEKQVFRVTSVKIACNCNCTMHIVGSMVHTTHHTEHIIAHCILYSAQFTTLHFSAMHTVSCTLHTDDTNVITKLYMICFGQTARESNFWKSVSD